MSGILNKTHVSQPTVSVTGVVDQQYVFVSCGTGVMATNGSMRITGRAIEGRLVEVRSLPSQTLDVDRNSLG
jgi:hypothetical protein